MDKITTITAISGWALPEKWFATEVATAFPDSQIKVIYPENPGNFEEAKFLLQKYPADLYIGYSLGSLWLLNYVDLLPKTSVKALLAPFISFLEKDGLGGTTSEAQVKFLYRNLKQESEGQTTLKNFFSYSELPFPESMIDEIPTKDILLRGLDFLMSCQANGEDAKIFLSIVGENDIFINGDLLRRQIPHLDIIQGVGHTPGNLLKRLANRLNCNSDNI
jgi:hypothetical protein